MTTIAFRDGILAADSRAYSGGATPIGQKQKIHKLTNGDLLGISTTHPGAAEEFAQWINSGEDREKLPAIGEAKITALRIKTDGSVFYYNDGFFPSGPLTDRFFAIGSGEQYALGAMSAGCTAEAAVTVAAQHDVWTDGPISLLHLLVASNDDLPSIEDLNAEIVDAA